MAEQDRAHVTEAGKGDSYWVVGDINTIKVSGKETGGQYSLVEVITMPGGGPPPHVHEREHEGFYVLEGEVAIYVGDRKITAKAGDFAHLPRGVVHRFANESKSPARFLGYITPAGFEEFFREVGVPVTDAASPPPPPDKASVANLVKVAAKYGVDIKVPQG